MEEEAAEDATVLKPFSAITLSFLSWIEKNSIFGISEFFYIFLYVNF